MKCECCIVSSFLCPGSLLHSNGYVCCRHCPSGDQNPSSIAVITTFLYIALGQLTSNPKLICCYIFTFKSRPSGHINMTFRFLPQHASSFPLARFYSLSVLLHIGFLEHYFSQAYALNKMAQEVHGTGTIEICLFSCRDEVYLTFDPHEA